MLDVWSTQRADPTRVQLFFAAKDLTLFEQLIA
jgi:hypothetical protein